MLDCRKIRGYRGPDSQVNGKALGRLRGFQQIQKYFNILIADMVILMHTIENTKFLGVERETDLKRWSGFNRHLWLSPSNNYECI